VEVVLEREAGQLPREEGWIDKKTPAAELENQILYLRAEVDNVRKRTEKRCREALDAAANPLLLDLLPVLDSLERATELARETDGLDAVRDGLEQVVEQFRDALSKHEVECVEANGTTFDPTVHEAVHLVPGEQDGRVAAVYEKGYRLKGRLLRPAKVSVTTVAPVPDRDF
jgi:molecular chaperone GrpE